MQSQRKRKERRMKRKKNLNGTIAGAIPGLWARRPNWLPTKTPVWFERLSDWNQIWIFFIYQKKALKYYLEDYPDHSVANKAIEILESSFFFSLWCAEILKITDSWSVDTMAVHLMRKYPPPKGVISDLMDFEIMEI